MSWVRNRARDTGKQRTVHAKASSKYVSHARTRNRSSDENVLRIVNEVDD